MYLPILEVLIQGGFDLTYGLCRSPQVLLGVDTSAAVLTTPVGLPEVGEHDIKGGTTLDQLRFHLLEAFLR